MIHPDSRLIWIDEEIGYGVFATCDLPRGTITWVRDAFDIELTEAQARRFEGEDAALLERYSYRTASGSRLLCWDFTRMMNHSCDATCFLVGSEWEIAVRDIRAGEQMTSDYGSLNLERSFECGCGSPDCRGTIRPEDFATFGEAWDEQIRGALGCTLSVEQALLGRIGDAAQLERWCRFPESAPSILANQQVAAAGRVRRAARR